MVAFSELRGSHILGLSEFRIKQSRGRVVMFKHWPVWLALVGALE